MLRRLNAREKSNPNTPQTPKPTEVKITQLTNSADSVSKNEKAMIEESVSVLDMTDKVNLVITESSLFVDFKS